MWGSEGDCTMDRPSFVKRLSSPLRTADFDYDLPADQVAALPAARREDARLMVMSPATRSLKHGHFNEIAKHLPPRSLLVLNDTRVIAARLRARKPTGGAVELLLTRGIFRPQLPSAGVCEVWEALARGLGAADAAGRLDVGGGLTATVLERKGEGRVLVRIEGAGSGSVLERLD